MAWYWYLFFIALIFCAGGVVSFLIFKNNPKYLNPNRMSKEALQKLSDKIKAKL